MIYRLFQVIKLCQSSSRHRSTFLYKIIEKEIIEKEMDMVADVSSMVMALEQATLMVKRLSVTGDPSHIHQIYSSLLSANNQLSSFLSSSIFNQPPPPAAAENSISSIVGDPMQLGEDDGGRGYDDVENEHNSKATIDGVEESMRECYIQIKRPKRKLSPSAAATAEQRRQLYDYEFTQVGSSGFDPHSTRLRSLDLIYQFHC